MNTFLAASLFDNPLVIVVIVLVSVLASWLSKKRAANQDKENRVDRQAEGGESGPSPEKPAGASSLEEVLRQLLGQEPPAPAPPPIPRLARDEVPPLPTGPAEESFGSAEDARPAQRPTPVTMVPAVFAQITYEERQARAARRFEQLNERGRHPARVVHSGRKLHSPAGTRTATQWRDPKHARQAFVASVVFAPPKGLEM